MNLQIINDFQNDLSCIWNEMHRANEHKHLATGKVLHGQYIDLSSQTIYWFKNGYRHRVEFDFNTNQYLPATYHNDNINAEKSWWFNGRLHRVDGHTVENSQSSSQKE